MPQPFCQIILWYDVNGEFMDKSLLKLILFISIFIGVLAGVLTAVPYVGEAAFWLLLCFSAIFEMTFLLKTGILEMESVQESVTIGAIIGFVSFLAFSVVYMPIVIILLKLFKFYTNYGVAVMLGTANVGIIILLALFMAVLSATINAFTGFLVFYINEFIKTLDKNEQRRNNQFK